MQLNTLTIKEAKILLNKEEISALDLAKAILSEIENKDKKIHAYLSLNEKFLDEAKAVDQKRKLKQRLGKLAGIPLAIKDNILIETKPTTCASRILENYIAPYDATVIKKLKQEDAIFIGKTNLDEFAMGASTENSAYGVTHNPHDLDRVAGGTSGGSTAAVAGHLAIGALGSDTGGSIRQPSAFCGVVGLRPTYGAVSRYGVISMASSLDQIGPIAKTAEDCKILFDVIRGRDKFDATTFDLPEQKEFAFGEEIKNLKIGVPKEYFVEGLNPEVKKSVGSAIKKFENHGAKIQEISLPHTKYAVAAYYIIVPSEVSANLARFDGIKYGQSDQKSPSLFEVYTKSRGKFIGQEPKRRITSVP